MLRQLFRSFVLIVCLSFILPSFDGKAETSLTINDVLSRLEKKYSQQSFEAQFNQTTTTTAIGLEDSASGKVWFSHPGKMRWQYLQPRHYEFITNGSTLWLYQPLEKQVSIGNAKKALENGIGSSFLSDFSLVRANNTCTIKEITDDTVLIELIPRQADPKVKSIQIQIAIDTFHILNVTTWNQYDDTIRFEFNNIHFAQSHPAMFEFEPPEGFTIIRDIE